VIKPRYGACRRGVRIIKGDANLPTQLRQQKEEYLVQEYVDGPEYSVGVLEYRSEIVSLPSIRVRFAGDPKIPNLMVSNLFDWTYDFEERDPHRLGDLATQIFQLLGLRDYARIDFRVGSYGPVVLDVNTLPNLHPRISLFPKAAAACGITYSSLIQELAGNAFSRSRQTIAGPRY
jgi:D-alanine-D-alanine ligase